MTEHETKINRLYALMDELKEQHRQDDASAVRWAIFQLENQGTQADQQEAIIAQAIDAAGKHSTYIATPTQFEDTPGYYVTQYDWQGIPCVKQWVQDLNWINPDNLRIVSLEEFKTIESKAQEAAQRMRTEKYRP